MAKSTDMIFVAVGDENGVDSVRPLGKPAYVCKYQVHARRALHVRKCHAKVHDDQALPARRTVAIDIGVHADLVGAAERQVEQPVLGHARPLLNR